VTRQYCHIGQRTIAYLDSAPQQVAQRTYVLLHAFPLGANMWEPQMRAIPKGWRLITPDLRGFGGTTEGDSSIGALSMEDYAADIVDLLTELGIARVTVGGCSMGGYAAFALVAGHPELVDALILSDTRAGADSPEGRANRRNMLAIVDREGPQGVARDMMNKLIGPSTRETDPSIEATVRRLIKQQSPVAIRSAILRMMHRPDQTALLPSIAVPTLIVVGEDDELTPVAESEKMAAAIKGSTLVKVPKAGHLPNLEQPAAFNAALCSFLLSL
jgi:pimeloyl-ACP methyl ester carboxylesterase